MVKPDDLTGLVICAVLVSLVIRLRSQVSKTTKGTKMQCDQSCFSPAMSPASTVSSDVVVTISVERGHSDRSF